MQFLVKAIDQAGNAQEAIWSRTEKSEIEDDFVVSLCIILSHATATVKYSIVIVVIHFCRVEVLLEITLDHWPRELITLSPSRKLTETSTMTTASLEFLARSLFQ